MGTVERSGIVTLVSQNTLFRAGLASLLTEMELGEIIQAASLNDLHNSGRLFNEDGQMILLIDASGQRANAVDLVVRGRSYFQKARIVIMTDDINIETMSRCFAAGLDGYLLEDISQQSLADSLRLVRLGEKVFPLTSGLDHRRLFKATDRTPDLHGANPHPSSLRPRSSGSSLLGQWRLQQVDRTQARYHGIDREGSSQINPEEDRSGKPDSGGDLGSQAQ